MSNPSQHGCKKCGSVVTLRIRKSSDSIELEVRDGLTEERSGVFQICCKKCRNVILDVELRPR